LVKRSWGHAGKRGTKSIKGYRGRSQRRFGLESRDLVTMLKRGEEGMRASGEEELDQRNMERGREMKSEGRKSSSVSRF